MNSNYSFFTPWTMIWPSQTTLDHKTDNLINGNQCQIFIQFTSKGQTFFLNELPFFYISCIEIFFTTQWIKTHRKHRQIELESQWHFYPFPRIPLSWDWDYRTNQLTASSVAPGGPTPASLPGIFWWCLVPRWRELSSSARPASPL